MNITNFQVTCRPTGSCFRRLLLWQ